MTRESLGRLHVITRPGALGVAPEEFAQRAAQAGAAVIQIRDKTDRTTADRIRDAAALVAIARRHGVRVIVNDHVDVALAAGADGVHLGRNDLDAAIARERLGATAIIGRTANDLAEANAVARLPIDYLGVGPVFGTLSKAGPAPMLGLDGLARIVRAVGLPVIAIGGIEVSRVAELLDTGAHGIAVLSAIADADDAGRATARFRDAVEAWLSRNRDHDEQSVRER